MSQADHLYCSMLCQENGAREHLDGEESEEARNARLLLRRVAMLERQHCEEEAQLSEARVKLAAAEDAYAVRPPPPKDNSFTKGRKMSSPRFLLN
jgi:hypothetical protein